MSKFSDLQLHEALLSNLISMGHETPTPIQEKAIPLVLENRDVLGIAQTGTGKTGAFCLPLIHRLLSESSEKRSGPTILVLAPTRELCSQIQSAVATYCENTNIKSTAIYGGVGQGAQVKAIRDGVDIIVATPGRLLDLLNQKLVRLSLIKTLVLDEADRMLDMGFIDDINDIIGRVPGNKQTLFFSATMRGVVKGFASKILKNPATVEVRAVAKTADNITQKVIFCKSEAKYQLLRKILKEEVEGRVIVFTSTRNLADNVVQYLAQNRMASRALHAEKNQEERERAIAQFTDGSMKILIATDLASRGIDVEDVGHVINFDLPLDPESYVHRIGRTARAGKSGVAISFCNDAEKTRLERIQIFSGVQIKTEKYDAKVEVVTIKPKKVTAPTPGKSQEKTAYLDHSKRRLNLTDAQKKKHPGFGRNKKKR